jgi:hypothetical protein
MVMPLHEVGEDIARLVIEIHQIAAQLENLAVSRKLRLLADELDNCRKVVLSSDEYLNSKWGDL